ncbi:AraC family transcriptional regulator [Leptothoe sp. PORK10 BA2]|uniref:AraC family transcriptional regulator n=1 Tax=Leptothoe sp. PORK10 BA2 TaxID=3110254 RepID=UPI002B1FD36A|nr:AraC family transcriptional regulator [Leptothoe sp. PORK10 BA2]MEA5466639.1 AraC family transcriptional regulator [Leptothoe sp. PORK10 BA2]
MQTDSARLWKTSFPGIELFEAKLRHHRFGKHFHEAYTIGFNESGQGCSQHRGKTHFLSPGSFNLINPGVIHTGQVASPVGWSFRNLYIDFSQIEKILTQLDGTGPGIPYFKAPILKEPSLKPIFYGLFDCLKTPTSQLQQQSLLLGLLSKLFQLNAENSFSIRAAQPESTAVALVRTYLEAHYTDNVSLNELAQLVNLSPYYLIRCFRQQVGCAPHQYQRHWQLVQVKQALQTSRQALSEIATDHGFYDQSHLNRAFKQTYGVTPGQYQKGNSVQYGLAQIFLT